ncbi:hypothetical protein Vretimale_9070 [Volvox reticuliferus]|uniref:Glycosyl transferase CAP10 domain-containing protein n=2 Tax=Volvox reticuliferus TaxID=1737510 RepID=A0A8J4GCK9_9CHLO|nr:hypothetical protein Vretifemale_14308 [Volvox reticuliferus]GIM04513.1 hypothetical protein Vretimale_9070 [Volvox reticuliferus]
MRAYNIKHAGAWRLGISLLFALASRIIYAADEKLESCQLHPKIEEQIIKDVSVWGSKGITEDLVLTVSKYCENAERITQHYCNCHPQRILIENGTVYLNNLIPNHRLGPHEHIGLLVELYEASQVYKLPDVEFTYWLDDHPPAETVLGPDGRTSWPYEPIGGLPPMVAWSKSEDNGVLMVPYSGAFRCASDSFDALEDQLHVLQSIPWESRKSMAFGRWNGFCTYYYGGLVRSADGLAVPCPRLYLNNISEAHPDLLEAYDLGRAKHVPLAHQNAYKYIVSTDGWSISSKFDKYLLLGSMVLKAASIRTGYYYNALEPYIHFVPFMEKHKDDIVEAIQWARANDEEAQKIARRGVEFAKEHLARPARLCYLFRLLTHLSKQYRYPVSCQRRKLCVPLVEELKYMSRFEKTAGTCNYKELLEKYATDELSAAPDDSAFEELYSQHEDPLHWPRDDVFVEELTRGRQQQ